MHSEMAREQSQQQAQLTREIARMQAAQARQQAEMLRSQGQFNYDFNYDFSGFSSAFELLNTRTLRERPPAPWAQSDPADSMYKAAYDVMNKGDYRKAAQLFKEIPAKFKYSQYAVEAMYWTAHALYRVGTTPDLQEALQTLETLKATYPTTRIRGNQADVGALQMRIAGVLSTRGRGGELPATRPFEAAARHSAGR